MEDIIQLRKLLHQHPELSNQEIETSLRIENFIKPFKPDEVIDLASTGKAFVFHGKHPGKTLVFRSELDALPIHDHSETKHRSQNNGISHSCGHDGHMAILAGLGKRIANNRPTVGKVVLLFQPAEEVEQGAKDVVQSKRFQELQPDFIFGLHNIPGIKANTILISKGTFAAASEVISIYLTGKTSHAAEPEKGKSPVDAISKIINGIHLLNRDKKTFKDYILATIVHIRAGEPTFGTSPGKAEIHTTIRAFDQNDFIKLKFLIEKLAYATAIRENLKYSIEFKEFFPPTINDPQCLQIVEDAIMENKLSFQNMDTPFKWSEDFGYYSQQYATGFFGLGAGANHAQLHNPEYDFPDHIIETGIHMFYAIYKKICQQ